MCATHTQFFFLQSRLGFHDGRCIAIFVFAGVNRLHMRYSFLLEIKYIELDLSVRFKTGDDEAVGVITIYKIKELERFPLG